MEESSTHRNINIRDMDPFEFADHIENIESKICSYVYKYFPQVRESISTLSNYDQGTINVAIFHAISLSYDEGTSYALSSHRSLGEDIVEFLDRINHNLYYLHRFKRIMEFSGQLPESTKEKIKIAIDYGILMAYQQGIKDTLEWVTEFDHDTVERIILRHIDFVATSVR